MFGTGFRIGGTSGRFTTWLAANISYELAPHEQVTIRSGVKDFPIHDGCWSPSRTGGVRWAAGWPYLCAGRPVRWWPGRRWRRTCRIRGRRIVLGSPTVSTTFSAVDIQRMDVGVVMRLTMCQAVDAFAGLPPEELASSGVGRGNC